jgi:hypothetical protein
VSTDIISDYEKGIKLVNEEQGVTQQPLSDLQLELKQKPFSFLYKQK